MARKTNRRRAARTVPARYRRSAAMSRRRRFAEPVDPDMEPMTDEFLAPEPEITDDTAPLENVSGQGDVSDDLVEPSMSGDSEAPVQDSVTARRRRARRAAQMRRRRAMLRRRAQDDSDAGAPVTDDETVDEGDAGTTEEEAVAKVTAAYRLATLQKSKGCVPAKTDVSKLATRIAKTHSKREIEYAIANLGSAGRKSAPRKSASKMPRKASKRPAPKTPARAPRKQASAGDASALFM